MSMLLLAKIESKKQEQGIFQIVYIVDYFAIIKNHVDLITLTKTGFKQYM